MNRRTALAAALAVGSIALLIWTLRPPSPPVVPDNLVILEPAKPSKPDSGKKRLDPEAMKAQVEAAVQSGKLTREQADAKLEWLRNPPASTQPKP